MSLLEFFGRGSLLGGRARHREQYFPLLEHAPPGVDWHYVRPRPAVALRAWKAERDGQIASANGTLRYQAGRDWIVEHGNKDYAVVRADIFERTYTSAGPGCYQKRTDVRLRYFKLSHPARIKTLEGVRRAEPGDWIIEGVTGEIWPVKAERARRVYAED